MTKWGKNKKNSRIVLKKLDEVTYIGSTGFEVTYVRTITPKEPWYFVYHFPLHIATHHRLFQKVTHVLSRHPSLCDFRVPQKFPSKSLKLYRKTPEFLVSQILRQWKKSILEMHMFSIPPKKTNMTMEHPPWMKMYFLFNMWIFQCHVSFQGCKFHQATQVFVTSVTLVKSSGFLWTFHLGGCGQYGWKAGIAGDWTQKQHGEKVGMVARRDLNTKNLGRVKNKTWQN